MLVYDTDEGAYFYWDGTQWSVMGADTIWTKVANRVQLVEPTDLVGIGTGNPVNKLDVNGGMAIGAGFAGSQTAPANGLIIEGPMGVGTATPSSKAILDLSANDLGLLTPCMTTAERNALQSAPNTADEGMLVYDLDEQKYFYWDGDEWRDFVGFRNNVQGVVRLDWDWGNQTTPRRVELTGTNSVLGIAPGAAVVVTGKNDYGQNIILYGAFQGADSIVFYVRSFGANATIPLNVSYLFVW